MRRLIDAVLSFLGYKNSLKEIMQFEERYYQLKALSDKEILNFIDDIKKSNLNSSTKKCFLSKVYLKIGAVKATWEKDFSVE